VRAYRVTAGAGYTPRFAGSQAEARAKREELMGVYDLKKSQISIEEEEVPTSKSELLPFINGLLSKYGKTE